MKKLLLTLAMGVFSPLIIVAQPVITSPPLNQIVLNGGNATFNVAATGPGLLSYQWQFNGTNLPNNGVTVIAGGGTGGDGGLATNASLNDPVNMTLDGAGNLYIADTGDNLIRRVDTNGIITTVAGNGSASFGGDGGAATSASINSPTGLLVDGAGNLWITDNLNNRIRRVDAQGIITTVAGNGTAGYSGDGGAATNASLNAPEGIALDAAGNLFIADYANSRVRRVDTRGLITTIAGNTNVGYSSDGILAANASLNYPSSVAFDPAGNLYIADYGNNRVRKVGTNGLITTVAGMGSPFSWGDGGPATNAAIVDTYAVVDGLGNILVSDSYGESIREVNTNGIINTLIGVRFPFGLAVDSAENLYFADDQNGRIGKFPLLGPATLNLSQVTSNNAGNYAVVISDGQGSTTSSVVSLTVDVPAYLISQPASQTVSLNSNATFSVTAGGTVPLNYQWLFNGSPIVGATSSTNVFNVASTNLAGNYSVIVTNNFGSVTSAVAPLTVTIIPPGIATQPASVTVMAGGNAVISVTPSGSPPFSYQWFFNGTAIDSQTNASLSLPDVTTNQAGSYSVLLTSPYGSLTSHPASLTVAGLPVINSVPINPAYLTGRAQLTASVSGVGPMTFQWQFNGKNLSNNIISTIAGNGIAAVTFPTNGVPATTSSIKQPYCVAADNAGNVYFSDSIFNVIRKLSTNGLLTTVAGSRNPFFSGDGGAATNAGIVTPNGIVLDGLGNLYFADSSDGRVRKVDTNGIITTVAGNGRTGVAGAVVDGGPATNSALSYPYGLAFDTNGNLYITDMENFRVRKVDTNGIITTVAGNGTNGFSGDGGAATNAEIFSPQGVAIDSAGNILIADSQNQRIRKVDACGFITTLAGKGAVVFSGDGGPATNAGLSVFGLAADAYGDVFLADANNNRIRRVDPYGIITTVAGSTRAGAIGDGLPATSAEFNIPYGVALDSYGRTLVADTQDYRLRRFGQGPTLEFDNLSATNAGNYTLIVSNNSGSVTSSVINLTVLLPPAFVLPPASQTAGVGSNATFTVTASGTAPLAYQWQLSGTNLPGATGPALSFTNVQFASDGNFALIITNNYGSITSSIVTLTVGNPPNLTSQPGSQIAVAGTNLVVGLTVAGDGLFSYQWQLNGTNLPPIITTVAGNGTNGFSGDGGPATSAKLSNPTGLVFDSAGNLLIQDQGNNRIRKVSPTGLITTAAGNGSFSYSGNGGPATNAAVYANGGVGADTRGNFYIAEASGGRVCKVDTNGIITLVAGGGGTLGESIIATNASINGAYAVALDAAGNMYISDYFYNRIRKVGTNGLMITVAGNPYANTTLAFTGDGGPATNAALSTPYDIAVDTLGDLFIADLNDSRLREVNTSSIINTVIGGGLGGSADGLQGTNSYIASPEGVVADHTGNVYISGGGRVRKMNASGIMSTVAGGGTANPGEFGPATSAQLGQAMGLAQDAQGNIYVADESHQRVRKIHLSGDPTLTLPAAGAASSGTYTVIITSPYGSVTSTNFNLTVVIPPNLTAISATNGLCNLAWNAQSNFLYQLQYTTNLVAPAWQNLGNPITATNGTVNTADLPGTTTQRYYRVQWLPPTGP